MSITQRAILPRMRMRTRTSRLDDPPTEASLLFVYTLRLGERRRARQAVAAHCERYQGDPDGSLLLSFEAEPSAHSTTIGPNLVEVTQLVRGSWHPYDLPASTPQGPQTYWPDQHGFYRIQIQTTRSTAAVVVAPEQHSFEDPNPIPWSKLLPTDQIACMWQPPDPASDVDVYRLDLRFRLVKTTDLEASVERLLDLT
jgi:hypothetical protein